MAPTSTSWAGVALALLLSLPIATHAGPQTNATCQHNFSWMDNESGLSPCLVAAYVMAPCGSGNYAVYSLVDGMHYDEPGKGGNVVTSCSCSWAGYNLLAACTACQGFDDSIYGWAPWKQQCDEDHLSNTTFFPYEDDYTLGTTIPYWAGQNPISWNSGRFNAIEARTLADEGHADLSSSPSSTQSDQGSSTPVGAIVGGVVGGLAFICIAAVLAWWLIRRHTSTARPAHKHDHSDSSNEMGHASLIYSQTSAAPREDARSYFGSLHGHGSSVLLNSSSLGLPMRPYASSSHTPPGLSGSSYSQPPPQPQPQPQDIIDPFTSFAPSPPTGRRLNPPAYTPSHTNRTTNSKTSVLSFSPPASRSGGPASELGVVQESEAETRSGMVGDVDRPSGSVSRWQEKIA